MSRQPFEPTDHIEIARDSHSLRDISRCPLCGTERSTAASSPAAGLSCSRCQLDLEDPRLAEVFRLGVSAAQLLDQRELQLRQLRSESIARVEAARIALEAQVAETVLPQTSTSATPAPAAPSAPASTLAASPMAAPAPQPAPAAATAAAAQPAPAAVPPPASSPTRASAMTELPAAQPAASARPRHRFSPQALLLTVGVSFVAIAAVVFLTVAFVMFNLATKAAIIGGVTALTAVGATLLRRTKLGATAEAIGTLAVVMLVLDLWALDALGMLAWTGLNAGLNWGLGLSLLATGWWAWGRTSRLRAATVASACSIVPALSLLSLGLSGQFAWDPAALCIPLALAATTAFAITPVFKEHGKALSAEQHILQASGALATSALLIFLLSAAASRFAGSGYRVVAAGILLVAAFAIVLRWGATSVYRTIAAISSVAAAFVLVLNAEPLLGGAELQLPWWCGGVLVAVSGCWWLLRSFGHLSAPVTAGAISSAIAAGCTLAAHFPYAIGRMQFLSPTHIAERYLGGAPVNYWAVDFGLLTFALSSSAIALLTVVLLQRLPLESLAPRRGTADAHPDPELFPLPRALAELSIRHLASIAFAGVALAALMLALMALPAAPALIAFGLALVAGVATALRLPKSTRPLARWTIELGWMLAAIATLLLAPVSPLPLLVVTAVVAVVTVRTIPLLATRAALAMPISYSLLLIPLVAHSIIATLSTQQLWPVTVLFALLLVPALLLHLPARRNPTVPAQLMLAVLALAGAAFAAVASWLLSGEQLDNRMLARAAEALGLPAAAALPASTHLPIMAVIVALLVAQLLLVALAPIRAVVAAQFIRQFAIPLAALAVVLGADAPLTALLGFSTATHTVAALGLTGLLATAVLLAQRAVPATAKLVPAAFILLLQAIAVVAVVEAHRIAPETTVGAVAAILATAGIARYLHKPVLVPMAAPIALWLIPSFIALALGALAQLAFHQPLVTVLPGLVAFSVAAVLLVARRPSPVRSWAAAWLALAVVVTWQIALVVPPFGGWHTIIELGSTAALAAALAAASFAAWAPRLAPMQCLTVLAGPALTAVSCIPLFDRLRTDVAVVATPLVELLLVGALTALFALAALFGARRVPLAAPRAAQAAGGAFTVAMLLLLVPVATRWNEALAGFAPPLLAAAVGALLALWVAPKPPLELPALNKLLHSSALPAYLVAASALLCTGLTFFTVNGRNFETAASFTLNNTIVAALHVAIAVLSWVVIRRGHRLVAPTVPLAIWLATIQFTVPPLATWWPFITATCVALATVLLIRHRHRNAEQSLPVRLAATLAAALPGVAAAIPQLSQPLAPSAGVFAAATLGLLALSLWPELEYKTVNPARMALVGAAALAAMGMRQNAPAEWVELSALPLALLLARTAFVAYRGRSRYEAQVYAVLAPVSLVVLLLPYGDSVAHPLALVAVATGLALLAAVGARYLRSGAVVADQLRERLLQAFVFGAVVATALAQITVLGQAEDEHLPLLLLLLLPSLALTVATGIAAPSLLLATAAGFGAQVLLFVVYALAPEAELADRYDIIVPLSVLAAAPIVAIVTKSPATEAPGSPAEAPDSPATQRNAALLALGGVMLLGVVFGINTVTPPEVVTLPVAAAALGAGLVMLATAPDTRSWVALGPGLALALVVGYGFEHADTQPWRVALMTVLITAALVYGAAKRLQAPLVLGSLTGIAHAILATRRAFPELVVPWWVWLALAGSALIFIAATYEARRRQARALFASVTALR